MRPKLTILTVIGTRPEGIKMAPVVKELARHPDDIRSVVCVTGQHRQMLDQVLALFAVRPDYDLDLMRPNQTLSQLTADLLTGLDRVILETQPDWVLAQGDTTTVLAASLVSFYRGVRFGHVEAGLRTGDKRRPFPEEVNRRIADVIADVFFTPTAHARDALLREGANATDVLVTGNTVIDALLDVAARTFDPSAVPAELRDVLSDADNGRRRLVLITAHRRESFGEPFRELCHAVRSLAERFPDVTFLYPVHLNPNVRAPVQDILAALANVLLVEPLDYFTMVHTMKRASLILTDSGGIQEEAPSLNVPVLVMRDTTERPEGVAAGVVRLVGTSRARIVDEASAVLSRPVEKAGAKPVTSPYGDGTASVRIVAELLARQ